MDRRLALTLAFIVSTVTTLTGLGLAVLPAQADPVQRASDSSFTTTKTLTRTFVNDDGSTYEFPANTVTVEASQTKELRGRQRIQISWTGAQPSGGRASNPYGEKGLQQEYPVVILQCRGTDDTSLPLDQQVRPETCWTGSVAQRSQIARSDGEASWIHDAAADPSQKARISGMDPFPSDQCPTADAAELYTHLTPFVAASGKVYAACDSAHMPPEAAVGAAFPPAEIAAFTDESGAGSVQFEVRSDVENESLGCNDKTACSIVVIPINGISCDAPAIPASVSDSACRKGGQFAPGTSNFANQGVDQAVSPALWWSASNWANRLSIPITMGLPPDTCDVLDPRPPTGFYGSELMAQAGLQWSPAYCLDKKRFKFQLNQMSDAAGWNLMESGGGVAAFVSSAHKRTGSEPVGMAPTAVTGFAIGYNIDRPDNAGEYGDLKLTPRLVAKLLTQSYLGSDLGRGHPGMAANPLAMMNDPEFQQLNPGLSQTTQEAGAALLSLSNESDIVDQLTDWIAQDRKAMDFVDGKPDPWGMVVNPAYKKIKLPREEWPLLDTFVPQTSDTCKQNTATVYFTQLAAPVTALRKVSDALLDGWPNVQTKCEFDPTTNTFKQSRVDRQTYGSRFMLGVISLGDAARYGIKTAALQAKEGTFVTPNKGSLAAAVDLMQQEAPATGGKGGKGGNGSEASQSDPAARLAPTADPKPPTGAVLDALTRAYTLDQADVRRSKKAYPGTMVVYTAAKLRELEKADAAKVALFIRTATTEGQQEGAGNGELPAGFLPVRRTGATGKLYRTAQDVADAVEAQVPAPSEEPSPTEQASTPPVDTSTGVDTGSVTEVPSGDVPTDQPVEAVPTSAAPTVVAEPVAMPPTQAVSSELGNRAVPVLLVLGLLGMALTTAVRLFVRPRGPLS
ncbi:hypothetical protein [Nocardioides flavescens]|uniref:Uncharacterized protein n=1 Tax=Nocardioides flavescens TaxID=2691959 RepID=A0A6L7F3E5_9ACTN|nr:hypothetical protein [Nocardioides flavescens]MXG91745.1 hypothetical protein [Nocardioides flavescens]